MRRFPEAVLPRGTSLLLAACCLFVTGCSRNPNRVTPVAGKVIVNQEPAAGAVVTFHPVNPPTPDAPRPTARVEPDGQFRLTSTTAHDGAPPGEYKVTVTWRVPVAGKRVTEADDLPVRDRLPEAYAKPETTPLTATVRAGENEPVVIAIKAKR